MHPVKIDRSGWRTGKQLLIGEIIGIISLATIHLQIIGISKVSMTLGGQMAPVVSVTVMTMMLLWLTQLCLFTYGTNSALAILNRSLKSYYTLTMMMPL